MTLERISRPDFLLRVFFSSHHLLYNPFPNIPLILPAAQYA